MRINLLWIRQRAAWELFVILKILSQPERVEAFEDRFVLLIHLPSSANWETAEARH